MLKFSTRSQYGLRAMAYLALNPKQPISLKEIAEAEQLSPDYLEKIFIRLKKAKLVSAEKGIKGGYSLALPAKKIKLSQIINALEGEVVLVKCLNQRKKCVCPQLNNCLTRGLWLEIQKNLIAYLEKLTLYDLIKKKI